MDSLNLLEMLGNPQAMKRPLLKEAMRAIDEDLWRHARAVASLVEPIGFRLGHNERFRQALSDAAWFHDIGKLSIPTAIIGKPGPLNEREWTVIRRHPEEAADFLAACPSLSECANYCRHHHERFDGQGYPLGLAGERIPLGARIIGVADAYHAMTSYRSYRIVMSAGEAMDELLRDAGTQFDPAIVQLFTQVHQTEMEPTIR